MLAANYIMGYNMKKYNVDRFYLSVEWRAIRALVLRRDGYRCVCCGKSVLASGAARVDHIEKRLARPDLALVMSNLRTLCIDCDAMRHAYDRGSNRNPTAVDANGYPEGWK